MNLGAILDNVQSNLESYVLQIMQKNGLPPSLMEKCIEGVQSNIRRLKAEEYAEELAKETPEIHKKTETIIPKKREELNQNESLCSTEK